jgi:phosphoserine phosphatase RsbU/P
MGESAEFGSVARVRLQQPALVATGRGRARLPDALRRCQRIVLSAARCGGGIPLRETGPAQPRWVCTGRLFAVLLAVAITVVAAFAHYSTSKVLISVGWLAVGPLLGSLLLSPLITAVLAGWAVLLGLVVIVGQPHHPEGLVPRLSMLLLLTAFAVVNAVLRTAAQRRLGQVRAVARVAQSALLREIPARVTAGRLASRYISAAAEARVGGDLLEVVSGEDSADSHPRWLVGDTRGKGLPAVRLASIAMTSFRDACAQPGLPLPEIARAVDQSVERAAGDEGFVTAVFAEFDPRGWLQLVICGHPPPLRLSPDGSLQALTPAAYATPLGLHPDVRPATFSVSAGDRLIFYTDGLLEARDRAGRYFRLEDCLDTLRQPDLEAAADELLARLVAHTGRRLEDDVALLLFEAAYPALPASSQEQDGQPSLITRAS